MGLFDSHVHLEDAAFDADRDAVVERARAAGVDRMVTVGSDLASSRAAVDLAQRYAGVYAAVAIHPHAAAEASGEVFSALRSLAAHPKVVAIGETGLDYGGRSGPVEAQRRAFRGHLALARECGLPVVVHCRDAHQDVLEELAEAGTAAVMHAFSGTVEVARVCAGRGYYISLAGPVTFRNAQRPAEVAREVAEEWLLVETDAPVLTPHPHRGKRNEPVYLPLIVERLAEIRGASVERLGAACAANAARVFGIEEREIQQRRGQT